MSEKRYGAEFEGQVNETWGLTFHMANKRPLTTNTIFDTYSDMVSYVNDITRSAIPGLLLSVINDTEENNGIYFVKKIKVSNGDSDAIVKKVGLVEDIFNEIIGEDNQITVTNNNGVLKIGFSDDAVFSASPIDN